MAGAYGRGGAALKSRAQKGDLGAAYKPPAHTALSYLNAKESSDYSQATKRFRFLAHNTTNAAFGPGTPSAYGRNAAWAEMERFQGIVAKRSKEGYRRENKNFAKPWLRRALGAAPRLHPESDVNKYTL